jgi:cell wall-associated NlpC family hydrolase
MTKRYLKVISPIANLRGKPVKGSGTNMHDSLQKSQLLFNERLLHRDETDDWYYVEAMEQQKKLPSGQWRGYPGWVQKKDVVYTTTTAELNGIIHSPYALIWSEPAVDEVALLALSIGTRVLVLDERKGFSRVALAGGKKGWLAKNDVFFPTNRLRLGTGQRIAKTASLFLGTPYFWGGRSVLLPWPEGPAMGVDCSALVNLAFRAQNIEVPRDAQDQWAKSKPVRHERLSAGDLIFLSEKDQKETINHVMIFMGGEQFIEAPETGDIVMTRTFADKFGNTRDELQRQGFVVGDRRLYFGRLKGTPIRKRAEEE